MHQRDLAGRAAEGQHADFRPDGERFVEVGAALACCGMSLMEAALPACG